MDSVILTSQSFPLESKKQPEKKCKSLTNNSTTTMNYESIWAIEFMKYTRAAGAIWGCMKPTAKTIRIHSALGVFACAVRCLFLQHRRLFWIGFQFSKSILALWISSSTDQRGIAGKCCSDLQPMTRHRLSEHSGSLIWRAVPAVDYGLGYGLVWFGLT